ncbi:hypothetical protein GDO78_010685 [Eleutherodactylus coqui]|uniref:Uncharacterized protein n=1 Tax=Eleutherodactylus coqui TaxID=57060 RepID=A0A8J6F6F1_ELECQ|nr:hypothetical protein GDO78_010685 [Eleutherodactylus coqui]
MSDLVTSVLSPNGICGFSNVSVQHCTVTYLYFWFMSCYSYLAVTKFGECMRSYVYIQCTYIKMKSTHAIHTNWRITCTIKN